VAITDVIDSANHRFGDTGWSSSVQNLTIDYLECFKVQHCSGRVVRVREV
jgi:recombination DNA repair RAD52 pathway protein